MGVPGQTVRSWARSVGARQPGVDQVITQVRNGSRLGLLAAACIFVAIGVGVVLGAQRLIADAAWVSHTHEVIGRVDQLEARLRDAESAQRGYLLTGNPVYLADYRNASAMLPGIRVRLQELVRDNAAQSARAVTLWTRVAERQRQMEHTLQRYRQGGLPAAQAAIDSSALDSSTGMREQAAAMVSAESDLLAGRAVSSVDSANLLRALAMLGIPIGLAVILAVYGLLLAEIRRRAKAESGAAEAITQLRDSLERVERGSADLAALSHYGSLLQSCATPQEALQLTERMIKALLPSIGGGLFLLRNSQDYLELASAWGAGAAAMPEMIPVEACWALRRGQSYRAKAPLTAPCPHVATPTDSGIAERLCLPLVAQGAQLGLLYLEDPSHEVQAREAIVHSVAEQLSMALATLSLQDRLREQSIRDPLTGLFNRRYLEEAMARELARCARRRLPLAVLMLDIDHFKAFNDVHGHGGGDALLSQFGKLLASMSRGEDIACRYGGEEFTLIMPEAGLADACARAEAVRAGVAALQVRHLGQPLPPVTVSVGVACHPDHGASPQILLEAADEALYRAKRLGRNRVEAASLGG